MLRFFRRIRKELLSSGKVYKYILYAVGEIALVVIGILIALQINTWNQSNVDADHQVKYLSNILSDLNEQLTYINIQKNYEKKYIDAVTPEITYFNTYHKFRTDSLFFANINTLNARKTFTTTDPSFTDLISSGNIRLIRNDTLKKKIISYYQDLELSEKIIQNNNIFLVDQQFGNTVKNLGYYFFNTGNYYLKDVEQLDSKVQKTASKLTHYNSYLASISDKMLQNPEKQLLLMNSLNQRANVALAGYQRAIIMEQKTNDLINEIEKEIGE